VIAAFIIVFIGRRLFYLSDRLETFERHDFWSQRDDKFLDVCLGDMLMITFSQKSVCFVR